MPHVSAKQNAPKIETIIQIVLYAIRKIDERKSLRKVQCHTSYERSLLAAFSATVFELTKLENDCVATSNCHSMSKPLAKQEAMYAISRFICTIKQEYKLIELFAVFFAKIVRRPKRQPQYHHKEKAINECHSDEFQIYIFF